MNDSRIDDDNRERESSQEIKADIAQTRAQMESKINQIQYKLDPERLKEQAQETVRGMVNDTTTAMMGYLRQHKEEISSSMLNTIKHNPIPAALIGVGLGWLVLETMSPKRERYDYRRNRNLPVPQDEAMRYQSGYGYERRYGSPGTWTGEQGSQYARTPTYGEWQGSSTPYRSEQFQAESGNGGTHDRSWMHEAKNVASNVKDAAQTAAEKAGDAVEAVRDAAGEIGDRIRSGAERAREGADEMADRVSQVSEQTRMAAGEIGHTIGDRGQAVGMQARQLGYRIENQVEDSPMMMGAVAFAVGAAVAMLMPPTRIENRFVGEARDRVMDSAKEMGQDMTERAQRVVEEMRPELEQTAKKVVENVKQVGQEAVQDLQTTAQKAREKAKHEGEGMMESAQSKTGATGTVNDPINWTALQGRWNEIKGKAKTQWGNLTDDDLTRIEGDYDQLVGLIQQKYGYSRSRAEQEVATFAQTYK
jgi:uncharacterized protein YjbJ (UPF0337 family)/gas vesicle protein